MAAETGGGQLWDGGRGLDDGFRPHEWIRLHPAYCAAVVAIIVATLVGAHWAGQPSDEMGTMSSTPSISPEGPVPAVE